jgi:hypothetical protein
MRYRQHFTHSAPALGAILLVGLVAALVRFLGASLIGVGAGLVLAWLLIQVGSKVALQELFGRIGVFPTE